MDRGLILMCLETGHSLLSLGRVAADKLYTRFFSPVEPVSDLGCYISGLSLVTHVTIEGQMWGVPRITF